MHNRVGLQIAALVAMSLVIGCGGGGGGGGIPGECADPIYTNLGGTWSVFESNVSSDPTCSSTDSYIVTLVQNGNSITVIEGGDSYTGTMCGNIIYGDPYSYPEDGGITTVSSIVITVTGPNSYTSTSNWTWSDGFDSCSGTSSSSGDKL